MTRWLFRSRAVQMLVLLLLAATGCRDQRLQGTKVAFAVTPEPLEFGFVYIGARAELSAELSNPSRGKVHVSWELPQAPFTVDELPEEVEPGTTELLVHFAPTEWGEQKGELVARDGNTVLARLSLIGVGQNIPDCPTPVACHSARFDLDSSTCVEEPLEDGTSCDAESVCILNASCHAGRCVGEARSCDDGNACTVDLCNPLSGCEHAEAPPCPAAGSCTVGVCDPKLGCTSQQAQDGTVCGTVTCDSAEVCIAGACVTRDPPDGFICEQASPCQGEGVCQGSTCVRPAATALSTSFDYDSNQDPVSPPELHDLMLEPDGALTLSGFYERPRARVNRSSALTVGAGVRRCILWNGRLACADHLAQGNTGSIGLIDLASGATVWSFNLASARPDFAALAQPSHLFMARLAALGPDRLAAIFEAYPANTPASNTDTQCRVYFLVILNAGGQMVFATKLDDPMLDDCDHPHPFGVVADAQGNLYMGFSPSNPGNAPLSSLSPTRLFAFSYDGQLKWKRTESFVGGELAVAHGVLLPERSNLAFSTASGAPLSVGGGSPFARPVASSDLFVPGPLLSLNPRALTAYRYNGVTAWTHTLSNDQQFATGEIRVATWKSGPNAPSESALLSLITQSGQLSLHAVELESGRALWTCPLTAPTAATPPELFEIATGTLASMDGAMTCGDCDPPFALSSAAFHTWAIPGMSPPQVAWPGTFGGAGHSHRETPSYSGGATVQQ
ncbi:MAG: tenascin-X [Myxococcaceae bacterium]